MFQYMLFITFTMIYAAKIPPAAVFEDNDSFSAPSNFMLSQYDSNESLQKYLTREKYSKQLEPSMDTYVAAYKVFHESYQAAEEKSSDEITRENHNSIDHSVKKRSAPTNPTPVPREMIKFELTDAKVPDFMTHERMSTKVPPKVADAVYEAATPAAGSDVKASGSRMIKIVHPVPSEFKMTRSGRQVSLDGYSAPVSKASFKLYLSEKHNPISYKALYNPVSSTRMRYATIPRNLSQASAVGSGQNLLGPLQTAGLLEYSGKNWLAGQDLLKSKRLQSRPMTQYVPTAKKPPKYGYTVPPANSFTSLPQSLSSGTLTLSEGFQNTYTPIHEGTTASEGNKFGEPFRSSLADPTFTVDSGSLAALTALIGKSPKVQLEELGQLLKKEKVTRPQESTSPILFHPTTEMPLRASVPSTTPISVEYYPEAPAAQLTFEDITRFYGGAALPTPFTPADDHKPIVEAVTEHPVQPTPPSIHIPPAAVTVRTPEDVLHFPQDFQASALVDQPDDDDKHESGYAFGYRVRDYHTGNDYGHTQNRDLDGVTRGQYHILLPDGRVQNVRYTADDDGFHAQISYDSIHSAKK